MSLRYALEAALPAPCLYDLNLAVLQENLEAILFKVMESKGFGAEYTQRYKMVNQFHQERRPLIIIVCGAPCTGCTHNPLLLLPQYASVLRCYTLDGIMSWTCL